MVMETAGAQARLLGCALDVRSGAADDLLSDASSGWWSPFERVALSAGSSAIPVAITASENWRECLGHQRLSAALDIALDRIPR